MSILAKNGDYNNNNMNKQYQNLNIQNNSFKDSLSSSHLLSPLSSKIKLENQGNIFFSSQASNNLSAPQQQPSKNLQNYQNQNISQQINPFYTPQKAGVQKKINFSDTLFKSNQQIIDQIQNYPTSTKFINNNINTVIQNSGKQLAQNNSLLSQQNKNTNSINSIISHTNILNSNSNTNQNLQLSQGDNSSSSTSAQNVYNYAQKYSMSQKQSNDTNSTRHFQTQSQLIEPTFLSDRAIQLPRIITNPPTQKISNFKSSKQSDNELYDKQSTKTQGCEDSESMKNNTGQNIQEGSSKVINSQLIKNEEFLKDWLVGNNINNYQPVSTNNSFQLTSNDNLPQKMNQQQLKNTQPQNTINMGNQKINGINHNINNNLARRFLIRKNSKDLQNVQNSLETQENLSSSQDSIQTPQSSLSSNQIVLQNNNKPIQGNQSIFKPTNNVKQTHIIENSQNINNNNPPTRSSFSQQNLILNQNKSISQQSILSNLLVQSPSNKIISASTPTSSNNILPQPSNHILPSSSSSNNQPIFNHHQQQQSELSLLQKRSLCKPRRNKLQLWMNEVNGELANSQTNDSLADSFDNDSILSKQNKKDHHQDQQPQLSQFSQIHNNNNNKNDNNNVGNYIPSAVDNQQRQTKQISILPSIFHDNQDKKQQQQPQPFIRRTSINKSSQLLNFDTKDKTENKNIIQSTENDKKASNLIIPQSNHNQIKENESESYNIPPKTLTSSNKVLSFQKSRNMSEPKLFQSSLFKKQEQQQDIQYENEFDKLLSYKTEQKNQNNINNNNKNINGNESKITENHSNVIQTHTKATKSLNFIPTLLQQSTSSFTANQNFMKVQFISGNSIKSILKNRQEPSSSSSNKDSLKTINSIIESEFNNEQQQSFLNKNQISATKFGNNSLTNVPNINNNYSKDNNNNNNNQKDNQKSSIIFEDSSITTTPQKQQKSSYKKVLFQEKVSVFDIRTKEHTITTITKQQQKINNHNDEFKQKQIHQHL